MAVLWYVAEGGMGCFKDVILSDVDFAVAPATELSEMLNTHLPTKSRCDSMEAAIDAEVLCM